ncbi:MAG TPA: DUF3108 domain-containing protein [Kiritimatiellia bacterium]|nr:DUF3108 domain-containing protein [Kiritimatiellia bacterium]
MNRRILLSALAALLLLAAPAAWANNIGFPVGEVLLGRLKWGVIPVGTARISSEWTEDEPPLIRLRVQVRSNSFLDRFYKINDTVESIVDPGPFLPVRFEKDMDEGGEHRRDVTFFDREKGAVIWHNLLKPEQRSYEAPREVRDILSLMYGLRAVHFAPGQTNAYVVAGDDGPVDVKISIHARKPYKHDRYGAIPALHIKPNVGKDGLFLGRIPEDLWISADPPYVLLKLSVSAPIGQIHLILDEIEGKPAGPWTGSK